MPADAVWTVHAIYTVCVANGSINFEKVNYSLSVLCAQTTGRYQECQQILTGYGGLMSLQAVNGLMQFGFCAQPKACRLCARPMLLAGTRPPRPGRRGSEGVLDDGLQALRV